MSAGVVPEKLPCASRIVPSLPCRVPCDSKLARQGERCCYRGVSAVLTLDSRPANSAGCTVRQTVHPVKANRSISLGDGSTIVIRPVHEDDRDLLARMFERLSHDSRR